MLANSEVLKKENEDMKKVVKNIKKDDSHRKKEFIKVKVLDSYFYKSFKIIRISGKVKKENPEIQIKEEL